MKSVRLFCQSAGCARALSIGLLVGPFCGAGASATILGTASSFAVLAGSTVTNTGSSVVTGNVGVSPGTAVTGFPPGVVVPPGLIDSANAAAGQGQGDLMTA